MKLALLLTLLFLLAFYKIYKDYEGDRKKFALDIGLLLFLLFATGFSKYMRIYLPLFVAHIASLTVSWGYFYLYLFGKAQKIIYIFAPILTIGAFFLLGLIASQS